MKAELSAVERHVYLALALHANRQRMARPGIDTLAEIVGRSSRTVQRTLRGLEDAGVIETARPGGGRGRPTTYHLPEKGDAQSVTLSREKRVTDSAERVTNSGRKGDNFRRNGDTLDVTRTIEQIEQENIRADSLATATAGSPPGTCEDNAEPNLTAERMFEITHQIGFRCKCGRFKEDSTEEYCRTCTYNMNTVKAGCGR